MKENLHTTPPEKKTSFAKTEVVIFGLGEIAARGLTRAEVRALVITIAAYKSRPEGIDWDFVFQYFIKNAVYPYEEYHMVCMGCGKSWVTIAEWRIRKKHYLSCPHCGSAGFYTLLGSVIRQGNPHWAEDFSEEIIL